MVGEAIAGLGALKTAFDLAKGLKDINDAAIRNAAIIELQERILTGQQAQSALLERVGELEKQVVQFEDWEREKERYELKPMRDGPDAPVAYALKEGVEPAETPHWICSYCYQDGQKSPLQPEKRPHRTTVFICHRCGAEYFIEGERPAGPPPKVNLGYENIKRRGR